MNLKYYIQCDTSLTHTVTFGSAMTFPQNSLFLCVSVCVCVCLSVSVCVCLTEDKREIESSRELEVGVEVE